MTAIDHGQLDYRIRWAKGRNAGEKQKEKRKRQRKKRKSEVKYVNNLFYV